MMRQDEELWMKKMKEALKDYSEPPSPDGWSRIEQELTPFRERRVRPYTWWAVAATLLLAVSGISIFFMQSPAVDNMRHISAPTLAVTPDVMPEPVEPETWITKSEPTHPVYLAGQGIRSEKKQPDLTSQREEAITIKDEYIASVDSEPVSVSDAGEKIKDQVETVHEQATDNQEPDNRRIARPSGKDKLHIPVTTEKSNSSKGKWAFSASVTNGPGTSTTESQDYLVMANVPSNSSDGLNTGMLAVGNNSELVFDGGVAYLKQSTTVNEIKHKQPISVGLSVRKNLANGFSIESGVTYTMLSSEGKSAANSSQKIDQKLHYIGIPIRGNWDFVDTKRFTVYVTAGGMVEKCVYGKIGTEKHTVKPLQLSLAGGIGGQLNISDRVGIYVEPGVSYFFDDGSDVETIRKENPVNFNLQAGIRFTY